MCGNDCIYNDEKTIAARSRKLKITSYDKLCDLSSRMFCLAQAINHGDEALYAFKESIRCEANAVWIALDDLLESERGERDE
jgi:hypothetical protein